MKASDLVSRLTWLMRDMACDPEVLCQSQGCCHHGHEILRIERGRDSYDGAGTEDEIGTIVIRV